MMKNSNTMLILLVVIIGGALLYFNSGTVYSPLQPNGNVKFVTTNMWVSPVGTLSNFTPVMTSLMPLTITVAGSSGQVGHVGYGLFGMTQWTSAYPGYPYSLAVYKIKLDSISISKDAGFIRVGLATAWVDTSGKTYYLEFDLWDSNATMAGAQNGTYIFYAPAGSPPTIEVKTDQLAVGQLSYQQLPISNYFVKAYGNFSVNLDGCYLVVEKTDPTSAFSMQIEFQYLGLG